MAQIIYVTPDKLAALQSGQQTACVSRGNNTLPMVSVGMAQLTATLDALGRPTGGTPILVTELRLKRLGDITDEEGQAVMQHNAEDTVSELLRIWPAGAQLDDVVTLIFFASSDAQGNKVDVPKRHTGAVTMDPGEGLARWAIEQESQWPGNSAYGTVANEARRRFPHLKDYKPAAKATA